jgi:hypothetical protein
VAFLWAEGRLVGIGGYECVIVWFGWLDSLVWLA